MSNNNPLIDTADFDRYDGLLAGYIAGQVPHANFVAERLLLGIYGQRQEGLCMVRTKVTGGRLHIDQLLGYAEVLERHSRHETVHVTTRQNIQLYNVPLEQTAPMQRDLARHGIATREAGGNTVRNVTTCPLAGICPAEQTDVGQHARAIALYFARNPLTESLPRKFKVTLSGCAGDCAQSAANDLSAIATTRDGKRGFRLLVGGGLGAKPRTPVVLDEFVEEADLLPSIEAVVALHDRHSDRTRKARSRIKFLVEDFGADGLRERYQREAVRTRGAFDANKAPRVEWRKPTINPTHTPDLPRRPFAQHQAGLVAVPVQVPHGDLNAAQLRGLHALLKEQGFTEVRLTADQNLLIPNVPEAKLDAVVRGLEKLGLRLPQAGDNVVACPGTASCQLGITASPLAARLLSGGSSDLRIRVNGCQNGCAQSDLADIGLYGKAKRHFGRMVPSYVLQLGGWNNELAEDGPEIPAARLPQAVQRVHDAYAAAKLKGFRTWVTSREEGYFEHLLRDLIEVKEEDLDALTIDHGETTLFRVTAVGVGECAGVQVDPTEKVKLDLRYERRLRDAFVAKRKYEEAAENLTAIIDLGAQLLLRVVARQKDVKAGEALAQLQAHLPSEALTQQAVALTQRIGQWQKELDELSFPAISADVDRWLEAAQAQKAPVRATSSADALRKIAASL